MCVVRPYLSNWLNTNYAEYTDFQEVIYLNNKLFTKTFILNFENR